MENETEKSNIGFRRTSEYFCHFSKYVISKFLSVWKSIIKLFRFSFLFRLINVMTQSVENINIAKIRLAF